MWKENINNGFKYVWLHASSAVKGRSDMKKFETARTLKSHIEKIRKQYTKELTDEDLETRQRSTALYLIDRLALRVGNEKEEDTADTVGCCSLRVEHVTLAEPNSLTLDFLGKDSMRYHNTVDVDPKIFKNIKDFLHKPGKKNQEKKPEDDLFDQLTTGALNKYLKDFMTGLSAKVFRTFNASLTLEKELAKMPKELMKATNDEKVLFFNRCNREVAILCNHQRTASKTHGESMAKIDEKIAEFEHKKAKLKQQIAYLKGKGPKPTESDDESSEEDSTPKKGKKTPEKTPKKETKKEKDDDDFESKSKKRKTPTKGDEDDFKETPKKKQKRGLPEDVEKCRAAIERTDASINKWVIKKTEKDELKSVALTTSKINYIDPRITVAWAKKVKLPVEKLFSKSLREKFPWAMSVDDDWEF
jgi:DNA topoisomerase-1